MSESNSHIYKARRIDFFDGTGRITLSVDGTHGIRLFDKDGRVKGGLLLLETGQPCLMFMHGPMPRVDLRLDEEGNPDLTLVGNRQLEAASILTRAWDKADAEKERAAKQKPARRKAKKGGA